MKDFTRHILNEYISMRRNALNSIIEIGEIPGIIEIADISNFRAILEEFDYMEMYIDE